MRLIPSFKVISLSLILVACSSVPNRAPVIDRTPEPTKTKPSQAVKSTTIKNNTNGKDWRPTTYTVKKGDTLYSIGLDFGYDYKEIAQNNNISPPYTIHIDQQLKIKGNSPANPKPVDTANNDDVVIKPLNNDNQVILGQSSNISSSELPLLNSPKALREPYTISQPLQKQPKARRQKSNQWKQNPQRLLSAVKMPSIGACQPKGKSKVLSMRGQAQKALILKAQ